MYQLTCPHCESINEVSAAKAGGEINCEKCHAILSVPKLGELRKRPSAVETSEARTAANAAVGLSGGRSLAFISLSIVCLLALLGAAFCGVNWANTDAPMSTERHLELLRDEYAKVGSAQMIREYEDITEFGVDIPAPLPYRTQELEREAWKQKSIGFGILAASAFALAVIVGRRRRTKTTPA